MLPKLNSRRMANVNITRYLHEWEGGRKVSGPQSKVSDFLKPYWRHHVVCSEFVIPGSRLRVDFVNWTRRIAIEVSPSGSHSFNPFFHKSRPGFGAAMHREFDKAEWLEQVGVRLIEVFDEDLDNLSPEWFQEKYGVTL